MVDELDKLNDPEGAIDEDTEDSNLDSGLDELAQVISHISKNERRLFRLSGQRDNRVYGPPGTAWHPTRHKLVRTGELENLHKPAPPDLNLLNVGESD